VNTMRPLSAGGSVGSGVGSKGVWVGVGEPGVGGGGAGVKVGIAGLSVGIGVRGTTVGPGIGELMLVVETGVARSDPRSSLKSLPRVQAIVKPATSADSAKTLAADTVLALNLFPPDYNPGIGISFSRLFVSPHGRP
jgi:hypothetical protein